MAVVPLERHHCTESTIFRQGGIPDRFGLMSYHCLMRTGLRPFAVEPGYMTTA